MTEREVPSLERLQSLEKRGEVLIKRTLRIERLSSNFTLPTKPQNEWTTNDHITAIKVNQADFLRQKAAGQLFATYSKLNQGVLDYNEYIQQPSPEQEAKKAILKTLGRLVSREYANATITVEEVDQQIKDLENSRKPLTQSLQERLDILLKPKLPTEELPAEEKQRRQVLLEAINSFPNLTKAERKSLVVGINFTRDKPGSNKEWARLMEYGDDVPTDIATHRLHMSRERALKQASGIKMGNVRMGREIAHYLILEAPAENEIKEDEQNLPRLIFNREGMSLAYNNEPVVHLTESQLIFLEPLYHAKGKPVPIANLTRRLKKAHYDTPARIVKSVLEGNLGHKVINRVGTKKEGYKYTLPRLLSEDELYNPSEHPIAESRINALNTILDNQFDISIAQIIQVLGKTRADRDLLPHQAKRALIGAVTRLALRVSVKAGELTDPEKQLWQRIKENVGEVEKRHGKIFNDKLRLWLEQQKNDTPSNTAKILQLEASLEELNKTVPHIEEAIFLGLPGTYAYELHTLKQLIAQREEQLNQLKQSSGN